MDDSLQPTGLDTHLPWNLSEWRNNTNITYSNECYVEMPMMTFMTQILYAIVCICGLLGNTLVIYVVLRYSKMQTVTNLYIANLAIADECFLIGIPFLLVTMSLNLWPFGNFMCKAYMTTTSINQFTSSIFLTVMSADRYVAICHPVSSTKIRTPFISRIVALTAWIVSSLMVIPVFIFSNTIEVNDTIVCNIIWPQNGNISGETAFTLYTFTLSFGIPLFLISIFYSLVVKRLRSVGPTKSRSEGRSKSSKKVTKLVLTVITVYIFCWLPYWVTQIFLMFTPPKYCHSKLGVAVFVLAGCLSYSNSVMNPVLYAFLSDNFKKSFVKAFTCTDDNNFKYQAEIKRHNKPQSKSGCSATGGEFSLPLMKVNNEMGSSLLTGKDQSTLLETAM